MIEVCRMIDLLVVISYRLLRTKKSKYGMIYMHVIWEVGLFAIRGQNTNSNLTIPNVLCELQSRKYCAHSRVRYSQLVNMAD